MPLVIVVISLGEVVGCAHRVREPARIRGNRLDVVDVGDLLHLVGIRLIFGVKDDDAALHGIRMGRVGPLGPVHGLGGVHQVIVAAFVPDAQGPPDSQEVISPPGRRRRGDGVISGQDLAGEGVDHHPVTDHRRDGQGHLPGQPDRLGVGGEEDFLRTIHLGGQPSGHRRFCPTDGLGGLNPGSPAFPAGGGHRAAGHQPDVAVRVEMDHRFGRPDRNPPVGLAVPEMAVAQTVSRGPGQGQLVIGVDELERAPEGSEKAPGRLPVPLGTGREIVSGRLK